jgi:hypothetical protein
MQQFITKVENIHIINDQTILIDIKGLDLSVFPRKIYDRNMIRRVRLKEVTKDPDRHKFLAVLDINEIDFYVQISRSLFIKLKKIIDANRGEMLEKHNPPTHQ